MKKKQLLCFLLAFCLLFSALPVWATPIADSGPVGIADEPVNDSDFVNIPDAKLLELINNTLNYKDNANRGIKDKVTLGEMKSLDYLVTYFDDEDAKSHNFIDFLPASEWLAPTIIHDRGIRSLEGLQYATNLTRLALDANRISDLKPIAGLTKLTRLELDRNIISDLTPLSGLVNLTRLNLYNNNITDISPLASLTELTYLDIHWANRGAATLPIDTLAKLENLEYISIESNDISDISALQDLRNLNYIKLNANHITDLSPIGYYIDAFVEGSLTSDDCRIEMLNQSLKQAPLKIEAPATGGFVELKDLPEIKGLEGVEASMAEMGMPLPNLAVSGSDDIDGGYSEDESAFGLVLPSNEYGKPLNLSSTLVVSYEDFMSGLYYVVYVPIEIYQPAVFNIDIKAEKDAGILNPVVVTGEQSWYSDYFVGTISKGDGVSLEELDITFPGNTEFSTPQSDFSVDNLTFSGNQFRFCLKADATKVKKGTYNLIPQIDFKLTGGDEQSAPGGNGGSVRMNGIYVGEDEPALSPQLIWDISTRRLDADSQLVISTLPYTVGLESSTLKYGCFTDANGLTISDTTVNPQGDKNNQLIFNYKVDSLASVDSIELGFTANSTAAMPLKYKVTHEYVYSIQNQSIEKNFVLGNLNNGNTGIPALYYDGNLIETPYTVMSSSDSTIAKVVNGKIQALKPGNVDITVKGLHYSYEFYGDNVEVAYLPEATLQLTVEAGSGSSGGSSGGSSTTKPETDKDKPIDESKPEDTTDGSFTDTANHWAKDAIATVVTKGLFNGTDTNKFSPEGQMTRGMLVTVLGRAADIKTTTASGFLDVPANAYYANYVGWAKENGIANGMDQSHFAPDTPITREQLCVMLINFAKSQDIKLPAGDEQLSFADSANISTWAKDAVAIANAFGLINGRDGNAFAPQATATRAEVAKILSNYLEKTAK